MSTPTSSANPDKENYAAHKQELRCVTTLPTHDADGRLKQLMTTCSSPSPLTLPGLRSLSPLAPLSTAVSDTGRALNSFLGLSNVDQPQQPDVLFPPGFQATERREETRDPLNATPALELEALQLSSFMPFRQLELEDLPFAGLPTFELHECNDKSDAMTCSLKREHDQLATDHEGSSKRARTNASPHADSLSPSAVTRRNA
ncbi:hypothetical protein BC835DRAFT_1306494 [Cytidiella melzeri]|nr:hypothetical protein BC835DRAFT_1306494 [Cytidiella melzeri]